MVLQDIEDGILLKAFKGIKTEKIRQIIDDDHMLRLQNTKKLMGKGGEEWYEE